MAHDWSQYEPSPGKGRQGWLVIEKHDDGTATEAFLLERKFTDIVVARVSYGPRGGVQVIDGGNTVSMVEQISRLYELIAVASRVAEARDGA